MNNNGIVNKIDLLYLGFAFGETGTARTALGGTWEANDLPTEWGEKIIYQGPQNDAFEMFLYVILDDKDNHYLTNFISSGYTTKDFNMDGRIIYQGPNNDRANLLIHTILAHPENQSFFANFIISVLGNTIENTNSDN